MSLRDCLDPTCTRTFLDVAAMHEHAEAVHTFDDIRSIVSEAVRDTFGNKGDLPNGIPRIWCCVADLADDWVVGEIDQTGGDATMQKASYSLVDGTVTFGTPVEVTPSHRLGSRRVRELT